MRVSVQKKQEDAILPVYGSLHSAGLDLFSQESLTIQPRQRAKISTGIAIAWSDPNCYLQICSRSGLFWNQGLTVEGGVIDWDYMREIHVLVMNHSDVAIEIEKHQRIAQGVFISQPMVSTWEISENWLKPGSLYVPYRLQERTGGLGSTGV